MQPQTNPFDVHIGYRLEQLREHLGLARDRLALQAGIKEAAIAAIEQGTRRITAEELLRLAACLETPVSFFYRSAAITAPPH